ncbi:hypothetical protein Sjap_011050 [Stephania japonica]|uniref:Uncharacterized protein n=1 Tax=Stephania japonica TaxID=461633 RepID=A0AAP0JCS3_9MAGN
MVGLENHRKMENVRITTMSRGFEKPDKNRVVGVMSPMTPGQQAAHYGIVRDVMAPYTQGATHNANNILVVTNCPVWHQENERAERVRIGKKETERKRRERIARELVDVDIEWTEVEDMMIVNLIVQLWDGWRIGGISNVPQDYEGGSLLRGGMVFLPDRFRDQRVNGVDNGDVRVDGIKTSRRGRRGDEIITAAATPWVGEAYKGVPPTAGVKERTHTRWSSASAPSLTGGGGGNVSMEGKHFASPLGQLVNETS